MMDQAGLTLFTFAMSHYSEKIRWALAACHLPCREVIMTPALHVLPALRMGGRGSTTLPILREDRLNGRRSHIQDSTRILLWLDERHGPLSILPQGTELRQECLAIEHRFDSIGKDVARFMYIDGFKHDDYIQKLWTEHAPQGEARWLRRLYPVVKWVFKLRLNMGPRSLARSQHRLQQAMAWLEGRISDGRVYLVGSRLTVADITAASLLAPLACPKQHPVYGHPEFIRLMRAQGGPWRMDRPALAWVRQLYDLHRGELQLSQAA